jgi:2,5-diamino-6-(ribosylamino)-4(3H)-pyrimidinone 5'-phosphate reductase
VKRPWVIVNAAMSLDGRIALPSRRQTRISSEEDMARVHRLRAEVDAVLVGIGTVLADDPKLTVKEAYVKAARQPLRIVLDSGGRTPPTAQVLDGRAPTLIVTTKESAMTFSNAEVVRCGIGRVDLGELLSHLSARRIRTVLVEGGEETITQFLRAGLVDEVRVFVGSLLIGGDTSPRLFGGPGAASAGEVVRLELLRSTPMEGGVLVEYRVRK